LPTAFTPDGNGRNDGYAPVGEFDRADFSIYNRWGQLLFVSSPSQPYWDGTYQGQLVPDGVYIVHADLYWTGVGQKRHGSSSFTLLR
jgi:gliding motility-associated-like protein